jgi:hypothetical protein
VRGGGFSFFAQVISIRANLKHGHTQVRVITIFGSGLITRAIRGVRGNGTENWNKIVTQRVLPVIRGRNPAVLARVASELDL